MRYIARVLPPTDDWSTRHSVLAVARRTADLLNVLPEERDEGGEGEKRADPDKPNVPSEPPGPAAVAAVVDVLRAHGEPEPLDLTPDDVDRMRAAAARLRAVFAARDADGAAAALNGLLREHTGALRLTSHAGRTPWHPHVDRADDGPWDEWFLASSCLALTVLLWDRQRPPGRVCASPSCDRVFIAQGSGPDRRYCSRRCATRERVAAHRRAARSSEPT
ncbi:CGNR zinc finger domain-containing protein [Streptomyces sp. NPDC001857]|uniref:CGNR zinc finger domain-containing protein n=1 Tax=unclassified Streptomyces TaxID=2593676 RepID=UPI00332F2EC8